MTMYIEVARALVSAGYLSVVDVNAAVLVLENNLTVTATDDVQDTASGDYTMQEDIVAAVENWAVEDTLTGDFDDLIADEEIIQNALKEEEIDKDNMAAAVAEIANANREAASALLAAELIDEADQDPVAAVINDARSWMKIK